jgi:aspartate beta-hydroxylase
VHSSSQEETAALETDVLRALQRGDDKRAGQLWERILACAPAHPKALLALSQRAFRGGDLGRARALLQRLVEADGSDQQQWLNLAVVCQQMGDESGEEDAIRGALTVDPSDLLGLLLRGNLRERQGKTHAAAQAYGAAAKVAPPIERVKPELRPAVLRAGAYREKYDVEFGAYMDQYLDPFFKDMQGEKLDRFRDSLDIMFGRKKRYESQSAIYHYPGLAPRSFFERADFAWLDPIEAATDAIGEELLAVLAQEQGVTPYLTYPPDQPHNQFAELNNSPRWSAFHLYQMGEVVAPNAARCPLTMRMLAGAPLPQQAGRTPSAMFSLLKPGTHIPPHTGVSNVRLVVHLPLIIPPDCGFRVGNEVRAWVPGQAWVFDDTIEHEAWNRSDKLRAILIFDIWHPALSQAERTMIGALTDGLNRYSRNEGGFEL